MSLLCLGDPFSGNRRFALERLAEGYRSGGTVVVVSAQRSAPTVEADFESVLGTPPDPARFGVVDCAPGSSPPSSDSLVEAVGSPGDLTGVGIALSDLVNRIGSVDRRVYFMVDSISTFATYADPERLTRFLNLLVQRIESIGATGVFVLDGDALQETERRGIEQLFHGRVEVRSVDGRREGRVSGLGQGPGEWEPLEDLVALTPESPGTATPDRTPRLEPFDSLAAARAYVQAEDETLTVCNSEDGAALSALESYFGRLNVPVREATISTGEPGDVALLHRGDEFLAASPVQSLVTAINVADPDAADPDAVDPGDSPFDADAYPEVLRTVTPDSFAARRAHVEQMVRISREVEMLAVEAGNGEVHAGFQSLSTLLRDESTLRTYRAIVDAGVDVFLYGVPDVPGDDLPGTAYGLREAEIRDNWFVVYRSDDGRTTGTLVAEEIEPDVYHGAWTFAPEAADATVEYLRSTYGRGTA